MNDDQLTNALRRLDRLERLERARTVCAAYAEAVDTADLDRLRSVFAPDATLVIPSGEIVGVEAIVAFYASRLPGSQKRHFLTNVTASERDGDVDVSSYYLFTSREADSSGLGWGRYRDTVTVHDDGARIIRKTIEPGIVTTLADGWPLP